MNPKPSRAQLGLAVTLAAGLAFAVGLQWLGARANGGPYTPPPPLAKILPENPAGWVSLDRPIADSEEMKAAINEQLNFDDGIFRIYSRGGEFFAVYAAHWAPGKMPKKSIATHTPDVCWNGNGWVRQRDAERQPLTDGGTLGDAVRRSVAQAGLLPAQFRIFGSDGTDLRGTQHLVFWHIYGGEAISYDTGSEPPWYAMFSDLKKDGLGQRKEQWFVRIGSGIPLPQLWADPGFQAVLAALREACLRGPDAPAAGKP
jgi:hypothetical protein